MVSRYEHAASIIREAEVFIITAGAGMGVDSGLPDFRGEHGFWNAYPAYARLGLSFGQCANAMHFFSNPHFAWGFYGHRTNLYRETIPHAGFQIIRKWIEQNGADYFVVTSNVDGQFQKAGYGEDRMYEVHGSIHWLQCQARCTNEIWPNAGRFVIDETTMKANDPLPLCPNCGRICRPNILMFGDYSWLQNRMYLQKTAFDQFLKLHANRRIAVIEMGAGEAIPTIRVISERIGQKKGANVIRINPREPEITSLHVSLLSDALSALEYLDSLVG